MKALTRAEYNIAQRIALGQSQKEVANSTFRSIRTVETTVKNIYAKLEISKATELTVWFLGRKFGISAEIEAIKRQLLAVLFILILSFDISVNTGDEFCRTCRRSRRSEETEIIA